MDQSNIPSWLTGFKPAGVTDANGKPIKVTRNRGKSPDPASRKLPTSQTIQTTVMSAANYTAFTLALEGAQPYGAHNLVHMWFDGTMSNVPTAPADPMVLDASSRTRPHLVDLAAVAHGSESSVTGADAILDPWPEQVSAVLSISGGSHPYTYDRSQL